MGKTLTELPSSCKDANKKVQLIYAFNGTGKTRLSRAFKQLIAPKAEGEEAQASDLADKKILYYSAFTEDLFYWDNDLERDVEPKLKIQPNAFTKWVLEEQGQDQSITATFQQLHQRQVDATFQQRLFVSQLFI
jgi:ABC-type amino acid transport substrate-binding protein